MSNAKCTARTTIPRSRPADGTYELPPFSQSIPQERIELGDGVDFLHRLFERVLHPSIFDHVVGEEHVAGARVAVTRLSDAANVHHDLEVWQGILPAHFGRRDEAAIFRKHA